MKSIPAPQTRGLTPETSKLRLAIKRKMGIQDRSNNALNKRKAIDDDIPSDDSEAADDQAKNRFRKRRPTATGNSRPSSRLGPTNRSYSVEIPTANLCFGSRPSRAESCNVSMIAAPATKNSFPVPPTSWMTSVSRVRSQPKPSQRKLSLIREQLSSPAGSSTNGFVVVRNIHPEGVTNSQPGRVRRSPQAGNCKWTFYSVWHPTWDVIWKLQNQKSMLLMSNDLQKLLLELLDQNTFVEFKELYSVSLIRVDKITSIDDTCVLTGPMEFFSEAKVKRKKITWKLAPVVARILNAIGTNGDILIQCVSKPSSPNADTSHVSIVHVTAKNGTKIDFNGLLKSQELRLISYRMTYDRFTTQVLKCNPDYRQTANHLSDWTQKYNHVLKAMRLVGTPIIPPISSSPMPMVNTVGTAESSIPIIDRVHKAVNNAPSTHHQSKVLPLTNGVLPEPVTVETNAGHQKERVNHETAVGNEEVQIISDSDDGSDLIHPTGSNSDANAGAKKSQVDLSKLLNTVNFVPGPLRPKLKKSKTGTYKYHNLKELSEMLAKSVAEDVAKNIVSRHMIKYECNTFGIVDKIVTQDKFEDAYFIRISDETMSGVLTRIHKSKNDSCNGPEIDVGGIIRLHRLTVQSEWDSDIGENTMVISTSSHHNYVYFTYDSANNDFTVNTNAKTITLMDTDKLRITELYKYKSERLSPTLIGSSVDATNNCDIDANAGRNVAPSPELPGASNFDTGFENGFVVPSSEGICASDIGSQAVTRNTMDSDDFDSTIMELVDGLGVTGLNLDESFFSTHSQLQTQNEVEPPSFEEDVQYVSLENLTKSKEPITLRCQVITLIGPQAERSAWQLILKEPEATSVPTDFRRADSRTDTKAAKDDLSRHFSSSVALDIVNPIAFEKRKEFERMLNAMGSDVLYHFRNVHVKGKNPPYRLEVDGRTCVIDRYRSYKRPTPKKNAQNSSSQSSRTDSVPPIIPGQTVVPPETVGQPVATLLDELPQGLSEQHAASTSKSKPNANSDSGPNDGSDTNNNSVPEETSKEAASDAEQVTRDLRNLPRGTKRPHDTLKDDDEDKGQTNQYLLRRRNKPKHYQAEEALNC